MIDYRNIIKNRELRLKLINLLRFIPDEPYLKMVFWIKTGKKLNLKNPKTFCDKLNWLKLHDFKPEFTRLADKIAVRDHIKELLGEDICLPLLGVWEHYDDIDFDTLPDKFVMKCNHDSGSVKIIRDKSSMDHAALREFFEGRLKLNPFVLGREYPYKDIKPRILVEKFMTSNTGRDIRDYKFLCFDGIPRYMFVISDRSTDCRSDFYDMDFNRLPIVDTYPMSDEPMEKPVFFDEMVELVTKLAQGLRTVRIDLYEIDGKIYFGEYTFYDGGGFWPKEPEEWEYRMGDLIRID
jgi:hypothetical protein